MDDHPALGSAVFTPDRFHRSFAEGSTVAGALFIHMFAPEALRAMVAATAVYERFHPDTAVVTDERFLTGEEGHREVTEDTEVTKARGVL